MNGYDGFYVYAYADRVDIYIGGDDVAIIDYCQSFVDFQNKLIEVDKNKPIFHSAGSLLTQYEEFLETY